MSRSSRIKTGLVDARIQRGGEGGFRVLLRQQFAGRPLERELHFRGSPEEVASSGAATMYCPSCKAVRRCDPVAAGRLGPEFRQRLSDGANPDSNWYRRVRMCRSCFYHFVTAEVSESLILQMGDQLEEKAAGRGLSRSDSGEIIPFPSRSPGKGRGER